MNKFDRVISTLVLLQTKKIVKASAISERYDISLRTVYRDISTLKNAGVPIIGDPGVGYSIMNGYRLPPIMFNDGEVTSLLTAEKFIGQLTDQNTQTYYSSAMMKIKAILRSAEKQSLAVLDESILISETNSWNNEGQLHKIFKSIASKNILSLDYQKADGTSSKRKLEPIGCYHQSKNWYLVAFCQLKDAYRTFKVNRIVNLDVMEQHFERQHISLQKYIEGQDDSWKEQQQFYSIEIAFSKSMVQFAEIRKYYFGFVDQKTDSVAVTMKFLNPSLEIIARWLLQFGDQATVIAPEELKGRLKVLSQEIYTHYN